MNELFENLEQIQQLLQQIYTITENQTTILLQNNDEGLSMIEQMADYKGELTSALENIEKTFQIQYNKYKQYITQDEQKRLLKTNVARVLELKDMVILQEQKNLLIMDERTRRGLSRVEIPKNPQEAVNEYKKHKR